MKIEAIKSRLNATPFKPFVIRLSDGGRVRVPHPDFVGFTPHSVFVGQPDDSFMLLDEAQIVGIEVPARRNGRR